MDKYRKTSLLGLALLLGVALLIPSAARAQSLHDSAWVGGKAALNLTRVRGEFFNDDDPVDFDSGSGFSFGGLIMFGAHPNVTVQIEVLYSIKNIDVGIDPDDDIVENEVGMDFIEFPLLAKLHGERGGDATPFVLVGGTLSLMTSAEQRITTDDNITVAQSIEDELDSIDLGFTFGGGVDLRQDWGMITIDARYTIALGDLPEQGNVKLDTFAVGAGVVF